MAYDNNKHDWLENPALKADTRSDLNKFPTNKRRYIIVSIRFFLLLSAVAIFVILIYFFNDENQSHLGQKNYNIAKPNNVTSSEKQNEVKKDKTINTADNQDSLKSGISMIKAKYSGLDKKQQPFNITADKASRSSDTPDVVNLVNPMADILLTDGSWVAVSGKQGTYMQEHMQLFLKNNVKLFHDSGYELLMDAMHIDIKKLSMSSNSNVKGHGPVGTIQAKGLEFGANDNKMIFIGPAKITLFVDNYKIK